MHWLFLIDRKWLFLFGSTWLIQPDANRGKYFLSNLIRKEEYIMAEKRCYTVQELQEILGVSRPTVYNLLKRNEFRWIQLDGGKYRISKKSFDDWLDKQPE